jgi:hypothetical protein
MWARSGVDAAENHNARHFGRLRSALDAIIAATAEAKDCVVVTDNERDFTGIEIVNPLRGSSFLEPAQPNLSLGQRLRLPPALPDSLRRRRSSARADRVVVEFPHTKNIRRACRIEPGSNVFICEHVDLRKLTPAFPNVKLLTYARERGL